MTHLRYWMLVMVVLLVLLDLLLDLLLLDELVEVQAQLLVLHSWGFGEGKG